MVFTEQKIAVLIDAENVSSKYIGRLFEEIAKEGEATIRRIYGDWTAPALRSWKSVLDEYSISTFQECSYTTGKSSADSAMTIAAMDILYTREVDAFCIVSSDSDFTNLARRLREAGKDIIGAGETKTPKAFVNSCRKFIYLDVLSTVREEPEDTARTAGKKKPAAPEKTEQQTENSGPTDFRRIKQDIIKYIDDATDGPEWIHLSLVGSYLLKRYPDFDARNYHFKSLQKLVASIPEVELEEQSKSTNPKSKTIYVRLKNSK